MRTQCRKLVAVANDKQDLGAEVDSNTALSSESVESRKDKCGCRSGFRKKSCDP